MVTWAIRLDSEAAPFFGRRAWLCARVLPKQAVRRAAPGGSEDAGGLWDKRGCQEGGGRPSGWGRRRKKERRVRLPGPAATCRALPGARAHPPPADARLT